MFTPGNVVGSINEVHENEPNKEKSKEENIDRGLFGG